MTCINNLDWQLANLSTVITSPKQPPLVTMPQLAVTGFPGKPNLLSILPLNGAVGL
jgi:hypothetical protein